MTTMLEKIAKAIRRIGSAIDDRVPVSTLDLERARAALSALREPTEGMVHAAGGDWMTRTVALGVWQAMLDAATKGEG